MALNEAWANGQQFNPADENAIAAAVNNITYDNTNGVAVGNSTGSPTIVAPGGVDDVLRSDGSVWGAGPLATFQGKQFETLKLTRNTVLTASSDESAFVSLEVPAAYSLEVPATTSLEVLDVVGLPKGFLAPPGTNHTTMVSNGSAYVSRELALSDIELELRHDFTTKADGTVTPSSDSAHQWTFFYSRIAALPTVSTGRFVDADIAAGQSANYLFAQLASTCTYIEAEFDFGSSGATTGASATCAAISAPPPSLDGLITTPLPDAACHCVFFLDHYEFSVITGGALVLVSVVFYQSAFANTAMQHVEICIDKSTSTVFVRGADGTVVGHHHATIGTANAPYVWFENISPNPNTDKRSQFAKIAADSGLIRDMTSQPTSKATTLLMVGQNSDQAMVRDSSFILANTTVLNKYVGFSAANTISGQKPIMSFPAQNAELYGSERYVSRTTELNLNTSNAETTVITTATGPTGGALVVGTTYRFIVRGTIQTQTTSGVLTFRVYIGANASTETYVMATQAAAGPVAFWLMVDATVRSTGASGTYISSGYGEINFATPAKLTSTTTTTAVVDTTLFLPTTKLTAQWATSSATNILKVETATIERLL